MCEKAKWYCFVLGVLLSFIKLGVISRQGQLLNKENGEVSPPDRFHFSKPLDWPDWKQNFLRFCLATTLHKVEGDVRVSALIYTMGREAEHVYKSFTLEEGEETKFDVIFAKFDGHFVPKRNTIHELARFHQRNEKRGESVESFVRSPKELSEQCDFGTIRDQPI